MRSHSTLDVPIESEVCIVRFECGLSTISLSLDEHDVIEWENGRRWRQWFRQSVSEYEVQSNSCMQFAHKFVYHILNNTEKNLYNIIRNAIGCFTVGYLVRMQNDITTTRFWLKKILRESIGHTHIEEKRGNHFVQDRISINSKQIESNGNVK